MKYLFDDTQTSNNSELLCASEQKRRDKQSLIYNRFSFIDLFAGIGGFRIGLEAVGGQCVFSCEKDENCQKTYSSWFGDIPYGDINQIDASEIPDHDLVAAGFPCQPFSAAGVSKKKSLGRDHGFNDKTQGNLFFVLASIISRKRPKAFILENVKNIVSHDSGNTWRRIYEILQDMNYDIRADVIDASSWVPQHRERVFIVGFDRNRYGKRVAFEFPRQQTKRLSVIDILEDKIDDKYILTDRLWEYLKEYSKKHKERGNGFGYGIADINGITKTLSARYYKDGSEILIPVEGRNPRRLTPRECARLMGFPDYLPIVVPDSQAYKQFGNAVVPQVVEAIAIQVMKALDMLE